MVSTNDFRNGTAFEMEGRLLTIVTVEHIKLARGSAVIKAKLRDLRSGAIFEQSFRSGDKYKVVRIEKTDATFLYAEGDHFHFMDSESYEQVTLDRPMVEDAIPYMKENHVVSLLRYEERVIGLEMPFTVELQIVDTDPGFKGDTVSASFKPAKLETGATVQVPLFLGNGEVIKVDTRTGTYMERVSQSS